MTPLIELQNVTKDYGTFRALSDLTLQIGNGITGLLGPNGAGKSTLIKVMLGLVKCTSGSGRVLGLDMTTEARDIRSKVGFMPEDDCYMHGLSGIECLQVAAQLSCFQPTEAVRRGHEILDFCGMGQERYRNVETFSTGMRQKLRFAMSIVHDPELLILDEPTSGLDPEERETMLNRIRVLAQQNGKAIIICTHILPDVKVVCDHVVIMSAGQVTLDQKMSDVHRSPDPSLTVRIHGEPNGFVRYLNEQRIRTEQLSELTIRAFGPEETVSPVVWQAASHSGIAIRSVAPSRTSLEEVFVNAVRRSGHADS